MTPEERVEHDRRIRRRNEKIKDFFFKGAIGLFLLSKLFQKCTGDADGREPPRDLTPEADGYGVMLLMRLRGKDQAALKISLLMRETKHLKRTCQSLHNSHKLLQRS